jgi:hypothetical protein
MEIDPEERRAVGAYAAGYIAAVLSQKDGVTRVRPIVDGSGVVTGELQFDFAGWECSLGVEAHRPTRAVLGEG